ncbi:MAG: TraX family protein [Alphaproteobacteria bacterium]
MNSKNSHTPEADFLEDEKPAKKILPLNLTSYDFLKTIAIVLMIVDHIGVYFYPEEEWFRILGRLCVPIWFFLIGYARTRDIPFKVILGIALIAGGNMVAGEFLFPVSILVTLMIGRYCIDIFMRAARKGGEPMAGLYFMLVLLTFPTAFIFEYGTMGLLFTVFGALCRFRQDYADMIPPAYNRQIGFFALGSFIAFIIMQVAPMEVLTGAQLLVLCIGMGGVYYILNRFSPAELPTITARLPKLITFIVKLTGRRTLEIYVAHLLVFKALGLYLYPDRFQLFQWRWTHETMEKFIAFIIA